MFVSMDWFNIPADRTFVELKCFPSQLQEPLRQPARFPCRYLVLKYVPDLPLFDERFINYGYNKIEYMEQLRFYCHGYGYEVIDSDEDVYSLSGFCGRYLSQEVCFDPVVNARSPFAVHFKSYLHSKEKPEMDVLWSIYRYELHVVNRGKRKKVSECLSRKSNLYIV